MSSPQGRTVHDLLREAALRRLTSGDFNFNMRPVITATELEPAIRAALTAMNANLARRYGAPPGNGYLPVAPPRFVRWLLANGYPVSVPGDKESIGD